MIHPRSLITYISLSVLCLGLNLTVPGTSAASCNSNPIPDPSLSSCAFPNVPAAVLDPDTINVTVRNDCGPMDSAFVEGQIVLETGDLYPWQPLVASGTTNSNGEVEIVFSEGIGGTGTFHFEVYANLILICVSNPYSIDTESVPVYPVTWGRVKAKYGN